MQATCRTTELVTNNTSIPHLKLNDCLAVNQEVKVNLFTSTLHKIFTRNADVLRQRGRMSVTLSQSSTRSVRETGWRQDTSKYAKQPPLPALDLSATIHSTCTSSVPSCQNKLCFQNRNWTFPTDQSVSWILLTNPFKNT